MEPCHVLANILYVQRSENSATLHSSTDPDNSTNPDVPTTVLFRVDQHMPKITAPGFRTEQLCPVLCR